MEPKLKAKKDENGEKVDPTEYRRVVGCLRYLTHTRTDLSFSVGIASRFMEEPTTLHFQVVKHILRYVKGTIDYGLNYGMIFYLGRNVITWQSQKQKTVVLSTCEAEFMAATTTACQAIWLANLMKELTGHHIMFITLYVDNKLAIALMKNPVFHGRRKHIDIRYHFIRERVERGQIIVKYVNSKDQRADIFTKALAYVKHSEMRNMIGVTNL